MMDNGSIMDKALGNQNPVPISQDPSDIVFMFLLKKIAPTIQKSLDSRV